MPKRNTDIPLRFRLENNHIIRVHSYLLFDFLPLPINIERMPNVNELLALMGNLSPEDEALIKKAYTFAEKAHEGHLRMSGDPYFIHLFETAKSLAQIGMGPTTIAAGFLHDTIEDVGVPPETIENEFGKEVLFLVEGVTKLGSLKYRGAERHVESLRKLFVATSQDVRVIIIKLMDRLHNMKTLEHVREDKRMRIALETLEIYAPIADRLGMGRLKRDLEDYAFPFVLPKEYVQTARLLAERTKRSDELLEKCRKLLGKKFAADGMTAFRIESRVKGLYSFYQKLKRKDNDPEKIHDLVAIRIILPTVSDCYRALGIVHSLWKPLPGKIKDYIAFPKPNGYQSLHTTVFTGEGGSIEIQLRTEEMHREAQWGIASHLMYKQSMEGKRPTGAFLWLWQLLPGRQNYNQDAAHPGSDKKEIPTWISQIAKSQEEAQGEDFMSDLRADFFSHRVFVFTPKGDVIDLPIDSSPIDFAYAIHSDIGNHIAGVKVNGKMVSFDTKLKNGDIVSIETKSSATPSAKWLEHVKTSMARSHIKATLAKKK